MHSDIYWFVSIHHSLPEEFDEGIVLNDGFSDEADFETEELMFSLLIRTVANNKLLAEETVINTLNILRLIFV